MKPLPTHIRGAQPFRAFLEDMATLGVVPVDTGGLLYAVIAARSNPRWWLLPLDSRPAAAMGLELLQPATLAAKTAKTLARGLARFGPHYFLGRGHLRLAGLPDLAGVFDGRAAHVACFTGTDGPHRKTALQVMDAGGEILGYAKFSRKPHIQHYIRNEAEVLGRMAALGLKTAAIPQVLALRDDEALTLLVTDSLKSVPYTAPRMLGAEHLAFLEDLRGRSERLGAQGTLQALVHRSAALAKRAGPDWKARMAMVDAVLRPIADSISVCLTHGDFTPWNTFLQSGRLYVFDWEYANETWPVGFDLAHFYLSTTPPEMQPARLPALTRTLAEAHFDGDDAHAAQVLLLCLACHAVFYLGRLEEADSPLDAWVEGPARAAMIDRLLATALQGAR
jgi:hypothetical protein